jgi:hypothetical protein
MLRKLFFHFVKEGIQFKGFGEEIINGACLSDLSFRDLCGEHNNWDVFGLPMCFQLFADHPSIFLYELHVKENEIGKLAWRYLLKISSSRTDSNIVSFKYECPLRTRIGMRDGYTAIRAVREACLAFFQAALLVQHRFWMEQAGFLHLG